jgi:uncharacterized protein (DUF302 family)
MPITKIEVERSSLISSKPFDNVVEVLKAALGRPDMARFAKATKGARRSTELQSAIQKCLGTTGLMTFMELDHGAILGKETGQVSPKIMRFIIGNPLIMKEMAKHVPDARSYAPVTILVDERADGVRCELAVGERSCAVHNKVTDESLQETLLTQESSYNQIL